MVDKEAIRTLIRRWRAVEGNRSSWHATWEDSARVLLPERMGFIGGTPTGQSRTIDLYDGTPMQAARGLANAMGGILRPDSGFFEMKAADDDLDSDEEAQAWMALANERLHNAMYAPKARFRQAGGEIDKDLVVFGTGVLFVGERRKMNGLLFQSVHLKDGYAVFDEEGNPNGLFRPRTYTLRQAVEKFGEEKLGEANREKLKNEKFEDTDQYLHVVLPRKEGKHTAMLARNMPFAALWIEISSETVVEEGGFPEFPFIVPRWDTSSGEDYGRSPGMIALPDANSLQAMGHTVLRAGQMIADPMWAAPDDGVYNPVNAVPGGMAYYSLDAAAQVGRIPVQAMEIGKNFPITLDMQNGLRDQVRNAFFRNVFNLPVDGPDMTATEIMQRKEEFIREIGPAFGRLESEYTAPTVERAFRIMLRATEAGANALPPIPDVLAGRSIRFEYESPIKRVRQQIEAAAARMLVMEMAELSKLTGDPEPMDNVDIDAYVRIAREAGNIPHKIVRSFEAVQARRQARQQVQQQQQQAAMAEQIASAAKTAGETPGVRQLLETAGGGERQAA